jgi:Na+/melibiose symporter-like transporter
MSFSDFWLINGGALMGWAISFAVWAVIYYLCVDWFDGEEAQSWFRIIMWVTGLMMLLSMTFSMVKTMYVHTERTTIDRSVGDESYEKLQKQTQEGEKR